MDYTGFRDEELMDRLAGKDLGAFGVLYDRYSDLVYSVALRVVEPWSPGGDPHESNPTPRRLREDRRATIGRRDGPPPMRRTASRPLERRSVRLVDLEPIAVGIEEEGLAGFAVYTGAFR